MTFLRFAFIAIFTSFFAFPLLEGQDFCCPIPQDGLMRDLMIVEYWDKKLNDRLPVTYNHFLHGGYFNMPSARMGACGEVGAGYSWVPPYINWNLRCQLTDRLEVSGDYRIFKGVEDPILTPMGFGDLSDKGANIKWAFFHPEDSNYDLPGLAVGMEDFMGTKNFHSQYVVLTQVWPECNFEATVGYGWRRLRGWFGGALWMPFRQSCWRLAQGLSLAAEYDPTGYKHEEWEKHPKGRKVKSRINFGIKYRLWDTFDFSLSYIRGCKLAFAVSSYYNFGDCEGFLPKIHDSLPYIAPVNTEPLGRLRPAEALVNDLAFAFQDQGFLLTEAWLSAGECKSKSLWIKVENLRFRCECEVRERFNHLAAALIPSDIDEVIIVLEAEGFPIQQYRYRMNFVRDYTANVICLPELNIITLTQEVEYPNPYTSIKLFKQHKEWFNFELLPKTHTFFGSSKGKFKFALGLRACFDGYLFQDMYYSVLLGYLFWQNLYDIKPVDRLNPSQLVNVRTDIVEYYKQDGLTLDEAYLQKNWNLGCGWFSRISFGYFEQEYGGLAAEVLYYPIHTNWAIGVEGAYLLKRKYKGLEFTNKFRKYYGWYARYVTFQPSQFFLDLYYNWKDICLDFKIQAGKFLADDWGIRTEVSRYFPSGFRITLWYTYTNGHDKINGQTYYDQGIGFSMPLDIFYLYSSRQKWGYGMSAWLRDVGQTACTGKGLYQTIYSERK